MLAPDGSIIVHEGRPYDPVKAHEYYMRNRKLKGRKKGSKVDPKAHEKFLKSLPMAGEGAKLKDVADLVKSMAGKTDAELLAESERIRKTEGAMDGAKAATIVTLMKNRQRIRAMEANRSGMTTAVKGGQAVSKVLARMKSQAESQKKIGEAKTQAQLKKDAAKTVSDARDEVSKLQAELRTTSKGDAAEALKAKITEAKGKLAAAVEKQKALQNG